MQGAVSPPAGLGDVIAQVLAIGYQSLSVVVLTAIFSGMVMVVQFGVQLARFGKKEYVGNVVSLSLVRELGPVLTALMGRRTGRCRNHRRARLDERDRANRRHAIRVAIRCASWSCRGSWPAWSVSRF